MSAALGAITTELRNDRSQPRPQSIELPKKSWVSRGSVLERLTGKIDAIANFASGANRTTDSALQPRDFLLKRQHLFAILCVERRSSQRDDFEFGRLNQDGDLTRNNLRMSTV